MKLIPFILFLSLLSTGEILAQDLKKVNYQIDFGTTLSMPYKKTIEVWPELENHPETNFSADWGYFFEMILSVPINSRNSILTGLNYSYFSTKINDRNGSFEHRGTISNSYITLPLMFKYRFSEEIPVSIASGPYLSFLVGAKEKGYTHFDSSKLDTDTPDPIFEPLEPTQEYNRDVKENYASTDYGLAIQLDYEISVREKYNILLLTRFNYGLKDVITSNLDTQNTASYWKNYSFMFGAGFKF
ncbi:porin family protein [Geofilum rubicundum]|uniref:Outer membrane protein beta-barrel domain-containing protein n=1 Tax=Geofilum rubicundum JCM 15548 TaxID=1236989 RepID=A0A0E9LV46_9BACT|nr:porin family protein [Geofilum rubicundum]GAO29124.1 hypothetical protein JCM15548_11282 [Geofilum rubicundum JCM 15548]